jgi:hypothetical protein
MFRDWPGSLSIKNAGTDLETGKGWDRSAVSEGWPVCTAPAQRAVENVPQFDASLG